MSKSNRINKELQLIQGIQKHYGKTDVIVLADVKHKVSEILSVLQQRVDASKPVAPARAEWLHVVENERQVLDETHDLVVDLTKYLAVVHRGSTALADFGLVPARRALTAQETLEKVEKSRATRAARKTMGRRQKEKVKGVAPSEAPTPSATSRPSGS